MFYKFQKGANFWYFHVPPAHQKILTHSLENQDLSKIQKTREIFYSFKVFAKFWIKYRKKGIKN